MGKLLYFICYLYYLLFKGLYRLIKWGIMKAGSGGVSGLRKTARILLWSSVLWFGLSWAVDGFAYLFYSCLFFGLVLLVLDKRTQMAPVKKSRAPVRTIPQPPIPPAPTRLLNGRYEILRQIKTGGMAVIALAKDHQSNTQCVIKTPKPGTQDAYKLNVEKLRIEAAYLGQFSHPHIVRFVDLFTHEGELHLAVEYVQGQDLLAAFATRTADENRVIEWASQILDAMEYVHRLGLVHRDINPGNIMLRSSDDIVIIDFGTVKPTAVAGGTIVSKAGFEVPEQARGYADKKSDIYGVGGTLFYLLTCTAPGFIGAADVASVLVTRGISERIARCIDQALQMDPKSRFSSCRAMRTALGGRT